MGSNQQFAALYPEQARALAHFVNARQREVSKSGVYAHARSMTIAVDAMNGYARSMDELGVGHGEAKRNISRLLWDEGWRFARMWSGQRREEYVRVIALADLTMWLARGRVYDGVGMNSMEFRSAIGA